MGYNLEGQCGLGHFNSLQITPSLIPNTPPNIVEFVCGAHQNLFLDLEGNVYSVGNNYYGSLGLGHNINRNVLSRIPDIPPIQTISCVNGSCYLIDFERNLWSFGLNNKGQLGHGNDTNINIPKVINFKGHSTNIMWTMWHHFFAKNSQNQITGDSYFELGAGNTELISTPKEMNSQYSTIWRQTLQRS